MEKILALFIPEIVTKNLEIIDLATSDKKNALLLLPRIIKASNLDQKSTLLRSSPVINTASNY